MISEPPLERWATWRELNAQPAIWRDWAKDFDLKAARNWVKSVSFDEVWFCGAGTSAYIGEIIVAGLEGAGSIPMRAVPTTDIVARPDKFLRKRNPLVVNFGRSGNSTETLGILDALDVLAPSAPRLNITCNPQGTLATRNTTGPQHVVVLPEITHDAGFAMTSSFSTMLLTALLIFDSEASPEQMSASADILQNVLGQFQSYAAQTQISDRIVFVGSGAMTFAARESALKVLELTAGKVPALWDSTLGFRHGPKSFVTDRTEVLVLTSGEPHAALYDLDLIEELRLQFPQARVTAIGPGGDLDYVTPFGDAWAAPVAVAFSQVLGVLWADKLNLNVDNPFEGLSTLSRVVSGVRLHEVRK